MRALSLSLGMLVAGCVSTPGPAVQEATPAQVLQCVRLGPLQHVTLRDTGSPAADLARAAEGLRDKAREQGATHVVPGERRMSYMTISAEGVAYRCD